MTTRIFSLFVLCVVVCQTCLAKPTKVLQNPQSLSPLQQKETESSVVDNEREQRSPQFGFLNEGFPESGPEFEEERTFKRHHKHHHKPGGYGEYPSGEYPGYAPPIPPSGSYPLPGQYPSPVAYPPVAPQGGAGGSFATASAGSIGLNGGPSEGQSQANAQSASFNFGPYSASFSVAEASSGGQRFQDI